jgi:hypothetical protein
MRRRSRGATTDAESRGSTGSRLLGRWNQSIHHGPEPCGSTRVCLSRRWNHEVTTGREPAFRGGGAKGVVIGLRHVAVREPTNRIGEAKEVIMGLSHMAARDASGEMVLEPINRR